MRTNHKSNAILIRSLDYGESDRIVTFFTDEFGKIKGIAKGARRSKKRFVNAFENGSRSRIIFSRKSSEGLALIEACDVDHHYPRIRMDLEKTLTAAYFTELVDQFTLEGKRNEGLFSLLADTLNLLETGGVSEGIVRIFELRFLKLMGYEPVLEHCVKCKVPLEQMTRIFFDPSAGGIRCMSCNSHIRETYPMAVGTVKLLLLGKGVDIERISRLTFSMRDREESRKALASFIRHLLGKELKSLNVLNEIKQIAP
jgi:DNA repair protein RecO (recombination protein O)